MFCEIGRAIQQKDKLYPDVNIQIANATIQEIEGKNHVTVASIIIKDSNLRGIYERAEEALAELYQEAGRLEFERTHKKG